MHDQRIDLELDQPIAEQLTKLTCRHDCVDRSQRGGRWLTDQEEGRLVSDDELGKILDKRLGSAPEAKRKAR